MNELTLTECSKRKLDSTYIVVYAIKNEINIKNVNCQAKINRNSHIKLSNYSQVII